MNGPEGQSQHSPPSLAARVSVLAAIPLICLIIGATYKPNPVPVSIARKTVSQRQVKDFVLKAKPTPQNVLNAELNESIRIIGADLPKKALQKGDNLPLTFYFETLKEMNRDWTVFVHIDAQGNRFRIHGDHAPAKGQHQTSLWGKGQFIRDELNLSVPLDAISGTYRVIIGFYIGDERMRFSGGDSKLHAGENNIIVGSIRVQ